ncbi:MAG TPA: NAD(P)-binding protein [Phycisphaerae bacterium]|jgi:hypothetical protein
MAKARTAQQRPAIVRAGRIEIEGTCAWPDGTRLLIAPEDDAPEAHLDPALVIVAGFGLVGRCVADYLEKAGIPFVVIDTNPTTVATQRCLGRQIVGGDVSAETTLREARLMEASVLALTIPDEPATMRAIEVARRLRPDLYIIARTEHASGGNRALQLGADEVVKAEHALAFSFHDRLRRRLCTGRSTSIAATNPVATS